MNEIAQQLYDKAASLPLVCPHTHVDPRIFADPDFCFGDPAELLLIPDHYLFRMLYSQGISLERLGIPRVDGGEVERDPRKVWQLFADNFHLFRGTPSAWWLQQQLRSVFGIEEKLASESAQDIYDRIAACLAAPEFQPRRLYERFNIEVLCTTDSATDPLEQHQAICASGWKGRILPTFRPDGVVDLSASDWRRNIEALGRITGIDIGGYRAFVAAIEDRRAFFKQMGAVATDQATLTAHTEELSEAEAETLFQRALRGVATPADAARFTGHMLMEMARMSIEDGLVMQLHVGVYRNHNPLIFERFGVDKGADIPIRCEFTEDLRPLLSECGNDSRLTLIVFTLDESTYARELAPLAGHYPALKLGAPWWFHDSPNGMRRYREQVTETAGLYNTAGFNDDARVFTSIPARHDLARRVDAEWLAGLVERGIVERDEAMEMIEDTAYRLAKRAYKL